MQVWLVPPAKSFPGMSLFSVSPANYLDWQAQNHSFEQMAAYGFDSFNVGRCRGEAIKGSRDEPGFVSILRVQPVLGRTFSPDEDCPGQGNGVMLGNKFWRDHFASDPTIVGRNVLLNSQTYTVIGVMPPKFKFPDWADLWVPMAWSDERRAVRGNHNYMVIGRPKPEVRVAQAKEDLSAISARLY